MPVALYRVDERLIHGQVVVGWGSQLRPDRYLVVDAAVAKSEWEQELYALGVPDGTQVEFWSPDEARGSLKAWEESDLTSVLLTRDLHTFLELARGGLLEGRALNVGGLHLRKGREEILPYLFLDPSDRASLRSLEVEGLLISAQDLPGSQKVALEDLLV
ncbi:MAG: PTS sugar transporter subunit IIB [Gemmatimonadetes bacterium]|nr:PTS sugar transporter subunit IIB [Gemmatimonadota bacterium]NNM07180.1 PTS sugar transporter subunit IIB [Gemmatimonadota bacterium]